MYFYDTCSLLNEGKNILKENFLISAITLQELEEIKTSAHKDQEIKFKARQAIRLLTDNEEKYEVIPFIWQSIIDKKEYAILSDNNDSKIILSAYLTAQNKSDIIFYTADLCCYHIAKNFTHNQKFQVIYNPQLHNLDEYKGYKILTLNEQELGEFYNHLLDWNIDSIIGYNEYLLIQDQDKCLIDQYKYTPNGLVAVQYPTFSSKMFGMVKPKDIYQKIAMDSLKCNQITMLRGAAGTGKSYLAFAYLFDQLERHKIDKIIIFCNTVATAGSARLGFYPGTRDEKLLDSQIGNLLASKLGDKVEVERLIDEGQLLLLPMSDIRGYDTTGMNAGVYISEAQNLDVELMRLALQRIGEDSICILDGDSDAQVDLPIYAGNNNGMRRVSEVFRHDPCYGEVTLKTIHRSHIAELAQKM